MMNKKISFHSNRLYNSVNNDGQPSPSKTIVPKWFSASDKVWKDNNGNPFTGYDGNPTLSFKNCPALLDIFTTGYVLKTPCDIEFIKNDKKTTVSIDPNYIDFCSSRDPMPGFVTPSGYMDEHFHWYPNWGIGLPKGYSALYTSPINRFELPFITVAGIIDSDQMNTPGLMPFFLKNDFSGVLKAGTPYVQIFPFKREDWQMDTVYYTYNEILERHEDQAKILRVPGGGAYKRTFWQRKRYS